MKTQAAPPPALLGIKMAAQLAEEKKHKIWLQTVFPAEHAAQMKAAIQILDATARSRQDTRMVQMESFTIVS